MADHIFKHCDQHSMFSPTCPKCVAAEHEQPLKAKPEVVDTDPEDADKFDDNNEDAQQN